jgi:formamidopyrimidine-DNA glycosylase
MQLFAHLHHIYKDTNTSMPELPEVEYTARQLRASVVGATIRDALVFWERAISHPDCDDFQAEIAGKQIISVRRRAKFLILDLSTDGQSGQSFLTMHRRMTGNLLLLPPGWEIDTSLQEKNAGEWATKGPTFVPATPEACFQADGRPIALADTNHCRVCFNFTDGKRLLYTDPRKFGRVELWPRECEQSVFSALGPEPLSETFSVENLAQALAKRKGAIKQVLLNQEVVAGLGNIYADEALYAASIHPLRPAHTLTAEEIQALHSGIVSALLLGIEHGGTSFSNYRNLWGEAGENYNHVQAYQRDGQPCIRCGTLIERIVVAQRGTHYCPHCQQI